MERQRTCGKRWMILINNKACNGNFIHIVVILQNHLVVLCLWLKHIYLVIILIYIFLCLKWNADFHTNLNSNLQDYSRSIIEYSHTWSSDSAIFISNEKYNCKKLKFCCCLKMGYKSDKRRWRRRHEAINKSESEVSV